MRLTQAQFKEILSDKMTEANGVSRLLALMVEIIMEGERELYKEGGEHQQGGLLCGDEP